jgi:hypothetical protein
VLQLVRHPNIYEISRDKLLYPVHAQLLRARSLHCRTRMMERFGIQIGFGTYLKLTEMCGKACAELLKSDERFRFKPSPSHGLGSKVNPKYAMTAEVFGEKFRVIYDAHDRMILTVFFCGSFDPHPNVKLTNIGISLKINGVIHQFKEQT